jgi:hypothetical protein
VVGALCLLAVGICLATLYYSELCQESGVRSAGLVLLALGVLLLAGLGGVYVVLQDRLASAERLAGTAGRAIGGG